MSGSCRNNNNYGGLTAFDMVLNGLISKYESRIDASKTPVEIRFLEHQRNQKIIELVQTKALKQLLWSEK